MTIQTCFGPKPRGRSDRRTQEDSAAVTTVDGSDDAGYVALDALARRYPQPSPAASPHAASTAMGSGTGV
jgi:hypothetical protein